MTQSEQIESAGSSTDVHVTGSDEEGTFTTDKPPTADTPSDGSSNEGINTTNANAPQEPTDQPSD